MAGRIEVDDPPWRRFDGPKALLAVYAAVAVVALLYAASTSSVAFGAYNAQWDGSGDMRAVASENGSSVTVGTNVSQYPTADANDTVAFVLSPGEPYTPSEVERVERFVRAGGTLVVAEDYRPHANDLLSGIGASARIDGRPLYDTRNHDRTAAFPEVTPTDSSPVTEGVETVVFNHGTVVEPGGASPILTSSSYAYLDEDGDGELDDGESLASRPVATTEPVGSGRVVVVGDPSVFVNAMLDRGDNRQFARNLLGPTVLLDYSHAGGVPPLAAAVLALRRSGWLLALCGAILVATFVGIDCRVDDRLREYVRDRRSAGDPGELSASGVEAFLRSRHPDWDGARIARVTEAVMSQRRKRQFDD
ncbi:DUF4350 domain-containing protein [Haloarcula salina]|uniref:DUF4350 domain-containing protein n=1 Tax=Haloarcula salina TaxID=1429914 RepID=UPI003C704AA6